MSLQFKVWLYGTRAEKSNTKKKLAVVKLPDSDLKNAKAFQILCKGATDRSWQNVGGLIPIPSMFRSSEDKSIYIESFVDSLNDELKPKKIKASKAPVKKAPVKKAPVKKAIVKKAPAKKAPAKKTPAKKAPAKKVIVKKAPVKKAPVKKVAPKKELPPAPKKRRSKEQKAVDDFEEGWLIEKEQLAEESKSETIELPELPKATKVTLTKNQFEAQMRRIIYDEIDGLGVIWPKMRVERMIQKLWKGHRDSLHLVSQEDFRRNLVVKELVDYKQRKKKRDDKQLNEEFRKSLEAKDVSLDPDVDGTVKIQFKEVFNRMRMRSPNDMNIAGIEDGAIIERDRQTLFSQILLDYNEMIIVDASDLREKQELANLAKDKVKKDVRKLFNEALQKGLFSFAKGPQYSVRLITPMMNTQGQIPELYTNRKGDKTSGYGIATSRKEVKNSNDLDEMLDDLFGNIVKILSRYVALNHAAGIGFSGFIIERLIK